MIIFTFRPSVQVERTRLARHELMFIEITNENTISLWRQSIVCYSLRYPQLTGPTFCSFCGPGSYTDSDGNLCYSSFQPFFSKVVRYENTVGYLCAKGQNPDSVCAPNTQFTVEKIMFSRWPKILSIFFSLHSRDNKRPQQQRMCTVCLWPLLHLFIHLWLSYICLPLHWRDEQITQGVSLLFCTQIFTSMAISQRENLRPFAFFSFLFHSLPLPGYNIVPQQPVKIPENKQKHKKCERKGIAEWMERWKWCDNSGPGNRCVIACVHSNCNVRLIHLQKPLLKIENEYIENMPPTLLYLGLLSFFVSFFVVFQIVHRTENVMWIDGFVPMTSSTCAHTVSW